MKKLHLDLSEKQMTSLRKGRKIRAKHSIDGTGCDVMVHPDKYDIISRTFKKGKGTELLLTPEEIMMNKEHSQAEGGGIFGKKFDKFLDKHGAKKIAYKVGDLAKPIVKNALRGLSATAIASNPELAPLIAFAEHHGEKFLDKPSDYGVGKGIANDYKYRTSQTNIGGPRAPSSATLAGMVAENHIFNALNNETGNNYGIRSKSAIEHAVANRAREINTEKMIEDRKHLLKNANGFGGDGLFVGGNVSHHHRRELSSVGTHGGFIRGEELLPPAMRSISDSANFLRQVQSPPQYQKYFQSGN